MEDLSEMYKSYANEVKHFLLCLTSNVDLAEELTQETFYQAVKSIHRYNGECKISVWLFQIAKHTYYDYLKKAKYRNHASLEHLAQTGVDVQSNEDLLVALKKIIHYLQFIITPTKSTTYFS